MNYTLLYSTTLVVSFTLTLILYLYHSRYWNTVTHVPLQAIYLLNMASCLLCIVWAVVDGKPELSLINYIGNMIEFNCIGYCGYCWLSYCLKFVDIPVLKTKTAKILLAAPMIVVTCMILSTPWTHWMLYIDEGGYFQRGSLYFFQQTGFVYLLVSSAICLVYRRKSRTSAERRRITVLSMFPLSPILFGSLQIVLPSGMAPTLQFSILISLILVFVDELDQKITKDSLTQLMNRYEFERILQTKMRNYSKQEARLYVLMSDLDDFKKINDTYGHQQGDASLMMVGSALTQTVEKYNAVCARMSGDEFISLLEAQTQQEALNFKKDVEQNIQEAYSHLPYTIHLSMGIAEYDGNMTLMELVNEADIRMYEQKKLYKQNLKTPSYR